MTSASALLPLWNRAAEWERRVAMIRDARTFLYLSLFYLECDARGVEILDLLLAAQRRGVAVNLLIDGFGDRLGTVLMTRQVRKSFRARLDALRLAGAVVTFYRPPRFLQWLIGGGHHVKMQVSDAGEAMVSSGNITSSSFDHWNEYAVALRGPVVRLMLDSYAQVGGLVNPAHLDQLTKTASAPVADLALDYWFCNPNLLQGPLGPIGWHGRNLVTDRMIAMIDAARQSIHVTSFYFKPTEILMAAVMRAARRGVRVEVYHSHVKALPQTQLAWIAAAVNYERLLDAGVTIYENHHGEHSKIVLIDRTWVAFGTYNFEDAAHDRLAEVMLASRDARAVDPAIAILEDLRVDPDNTIVTPQSLRAWPMRLKIKRAVFGRFKWWM